MWEDEATTDLTNRCFEATGGHKQEGVTTKIIRKNIDRENENEAA
jgi:hypothetical protein